MWTKLFFETFFLLLFIVSDQLAIELTQVFFLDLLCIKIVLCVAIDPEQEQQDETIMASQRDIVAQEHQFVALVNQHIPEQSCHAVSPR